MRLPGLQITVAHRSGALPVAVVYVKGDITAATYQQLQDQARQMIEQGTRFIVLDLSEVPYMSSAGFRAIHYMFHALRGDAPEDSDEAMRVGMKAGTYRSPHLKIAHPTPRVREILKLAGIGMFIEICDDLQQAITSFRQPI